MHVAQPAPVTQRKDEDVEPPRFHLTSTVRRRPRSPGGVLARQALTPATVAPHSGAVTPAENGEAYFLRTPFAQNSVRDARSHHSMCPRASRSTSRLASGVRFVRISAESSSLEAYRTAVRSTPRDTFSREALWSVRQNSRCVQHADSSRSSPWYFQSVPKLCCARAHSVKIPAPASFVSATSVPAASPVLTAPGPFRRQRVYCHRLRRKPLR